MYNSEIEYTYETENGSEATVTIDYSYTPGRPANTRYGHPDNYSPAEPSEIDLGEIRSGGVVMGREESIKFLDQHSDSIYEQIERQEEK